MTETLEYFEVLEPIYLPDFRVTDPIVIPIVNGDATGDPNTISWAEVVGKPSTFTPSPHIHSQTDVTGLLQEINSLQDDISEIGDDFDFETNIEAWLAPGL